MLDHPGDILTVNQYLSALRTQQSDQQLEKYALPLAAQSDYGGDPTFRDVQAQSIYDVFAVKTLDYVD